MPFTDRLGYLAPLANNVAYAIAVERLADITIPERCQALRVLICELARISSHLLGIGVFGMDAGAWTPFMYTFTEREKLYDLFEKLTGARFTTSYTRIGGVARDVPEGWLGEVKQFCNELPKTLEDVSNLLTRNRIFFDRTQGIGTISKEDALAFGLTGANLRASGIDLDLRKDKPYSGYEQYDLMSLLAPAATASRYIVYGGNLSKPSICRKLSTNSQVDLGMLKTPKIYAPTKTRFSQHGGTPELHDRRRAPNSRRRIYF